MLRAIELTWLDSFDDYLEYGGTALVEYIRYDEDGKIVNEIVSIALPNRLDKEQHKWAKDVITQAFHNGEGYNV